MVKLGVTLRDCRKPFFLVTLLQEEFKPHHNSKKTALLIDVLSPKVFYISCKFHTMFRVVVHA